MGRRIEYPWDVLQRAGVGRARELDDDVVVRGDDATQPGIPDDYSNRLMKFVPAEAVALFVAAAPHASTTAMWWAALFVGALVVVLTMPDLRKMTWWTLPLSLGAFAAWTFGTTQVDEVLFGLTATWSALILTFGTFLIPLIDLRLTALFGRR
ncbi:hypothetical protein [uncultured Nocardioides sp.]|uniref:hypothetical protein n=1 Tax=uncultured Nocardioides sp. TaxID=198441 RepID=UPI00262E09AA|nr:hypothetical protein [uncultured Nocardioides sp.]